VLVGGGGGEVAQVGGGLGGARSVRQREQLVVAGIGAGGSVDLAGAVQVHQFGVGAALGQPCEQRLGGVDAVVEQQRERQQQGQQEQQRGRQIVVSGGEQLQAAGFGQGQGRAEGRRLQEVGEVAAAAGGVAVEQRQGDDGGGGIGPLASLPHSILSPPPIEIALASIGITVCITVHFPCSRHPLDAI
jgi:hypothetical protein